MERESERENKINKNEYSLIFDSLLFFGSEYIKNNREW